MAVDRKVSFKLPESLARRIEFLSEQTVEQVAVELLEGFVQDGRRRSIKLVSVAISWPEDWYKMFLKVWGENKVAPNVREVTRSFIMKDPLRGDWVPSAAPDMRNRLENHVSRDIKVRSDGLSFIAHALLPADWVEWIDRHYPSKRSTYIKLAVYYHIKSWPWPRNTSPSVPKGLLKFESDNM